MNTELLNAIQTRCNIYVTCYENDIKNGELILDRLLYYTRLLDDYENALRTMYFDFDCIDDETFDLGVKMIGAFSNTLVDIYTENK